MSDELVLGPNRVRVIAHGDDTADRFSLVEWRMAPLPAPGPQVHRHPTADEAFFVIDGHLDVTVDDATTRLDPGGFAFVPRMTWHTVANAGAGECRFLALFSPPGFEGLWEQTAALLAAGPARAEEILALQVRFGMETKDGRARLFDAPKES